jgi:hypothetical protein
VPLERHWERVHTPLRATARRELRALVIVTSVLVVAVVGLLFATLRGGSPQAQSGCVRLTIPSTTGGATLNACGETAARWCRSIAGRDDALSRRAMEHCRRAGYP